MSRNRDIFEFTLKMSRNRDILEFLTEISRHFRKIPRQFRRDIFKVTSKMSRNGTFLIFLQKPFENVSFRDIFEFFRDIFEFLRYFPVFGDILAQNSKMSRKNSKMSRKKRDNFENETIPVATAIFKRRQIKLRRNYNQFTKPSFTNRTYNVRQTKPKQQSS